MKSLIIVTAFLVLLPVLITSCNTSSNSNSEQVMLYAAPLPKTVWVPGSITLRIPSGRAGPDVEYTFTSSLRSDVPEEQAVYTWKVDGVEVVDQQSSYPQLIIDAGQFESSSYPAEYEIEVEIGWVDLDTGNWMRARDRGIFIVDEGPIPNTGGRITCPCCGNATWMSLKRKHGDGPTIVTRACAAHAVVLHLELKYIKTVIARGAIRKKDRRRIAGTRPRQQRIRNRIESMDHRTAPR